MLMDDTSEMLSANVLVDVRGCQCSIIDT